MTEQEAIKDIKRQIWEINSDDADITISTKSLVMAIKALEKQVAKKPVLVTRGLIKFYPCPNADCSNPSKYTQVYPNQKYCVYCGQKLDWEEV